MPAHTEPAAIRRAHLSVSSARADEAQRGRVIWDADAKPPPDYEGL